MGKGTSQDIREGWVQMIPKIIKIAQEESDKGTIEVLLSTTPEDIPDGKLPGYVHTCTMV